MHDPNIPPPRERDIPLREGNIPLSRSRRGDIPLLVDETVPRLGIAAPRVAHDYSATSRPDLDLDSVGAVDRARTGLGVTLD